MFTNKLWNSEVKVIKSSDIFIGITPSAYSIMNYLNTKIVHSEFSILFKGQFQEKIWIITGDFVIPKQEVSGASVDYIDDLAVYRQQGYNTIMHKHPDSIDSFSSADFESINQHFPVSILYCKQKITDATMLIPINDNTKLMISIPKENIVIIPDTSQSSEIDKYIQNISEKKYEYPYHPLDYYSYYYHRNLDPYDYGSDLQDYYTYNSVHRNVENTESNSSNSKLQKVKKIKQIKQKLDKIFDENGMLIKRGEE